MQLWAGQGRILVVVEGEGKGDLRVVRMKEMRWRTAGWRGGGGGGDGGEEDGGRKKRLRLEVGGWMRWSKE